MGEIFSTLFQIQIKKIKNCVSIKRVLERENKKFNFKKKKNERCLFIYLFQRVFYLLHCLMCWKKI